LTLFSTLTAVYFFGIFNDEFPLIARGCDQFELAARHMEELFLTLRLPPDFFPSRSLQLIEVKLLRLERKTPADVIRPVTISCEESCSISSFSDFAQRKRRIVFWPQAPALCSALIVIHRSNPSRGKHFRLASVDLEPVKRAADLSAGESKAVGPWLTGKHGESAEVLRDIWHALAVRGSRVRRAEETLFAWVGDVIAEGIARELVHPGCIAEASSGTPDVVHRVVADEGVGSAETFLGGVGVAIDCLEEGEDGCDGECDWLHG